MRSLYLRIWLTVVAALALFALVSGLMWQRHLDGERARFEHDASERLAVWAEMVERSLPAPGAERSAQSQALNEWSERLRVPLALDAADGQRIATSASFTRRESDRLRYTLVSVRLDDGRTLHLLRRLPPHLRERGRVPPDGPQPGIDGPMDGELPPWRDAPRGAQGPVGANGPAPQGGSAAPLGGVPDFGPGRDGPSGPPSFRPPRMADDGLLPLPLGLPSGVGPLVLVAMLFVAVAGGAYPVVRRLTRRLEALKQGVATFGAGELGARVDESGRDEVAAVAATFNRTAERIETLVQSHKNLLANASHELRSPLARLKMAVAMMGDTTPAHAAELRREIDTNIRELDALVEEVLLASRLDAGAAFDLGDPVDLLGLAAEEAARTGAQVDADPEGDWLIRGNERLLRRALRNLLENARRYADGDVQVQVLRTPGGGHEWQVCDRGPGVPEDFRERIFEPYFRLPGHAEREGGVGLGLSLVRQIVQAHGGQVRCEPREGGGSRFRILLPPR